MRRVRVAEFAEARAPTTDPNLRLAIALALFTLLGCRGDVTQPGPITGTYALAAIRGKPLPAPYAGMSITSSRLTVLAAGTWTETQSGIAAEGVRNTTYFGTWIDSGSEVTFHVGATAFYTGVATSSGLRLSTGSTDFEYSRE